ncbi:MAG: M56 family metallopeptidase [Clostridia bacterium]|nr:M56 family metallopeptidase [Clostridia bacterium]
MDYSGIFLTLNDIFLRVVNLSLSACGIMLVLMLIRLLLKKMSKLYVVLMWLLVGLRLIIPFSFESEFSVNPNREIINPETVYSNKFVIDSGYDSVDTVVNGYLGDNYYEGVTVPTNFKLNIISVLAIIWVFGVLACLLYFLIYYLRMKIKLKTATLVNDNVFRTEFVSSPFVFGIFRPKIYIPYGLEEPNLRYVLVHEKTHIEQSHHLDKLVAFIILSVYWFNPFLWLAYWLFSKDIESFCDELVVKKLTEDERTEYSKVLLELSIRKKSFSVAPVPFGEIDIKKRVKDIMNFRKPGFWISLAATLIFVITANCLFTDPPKDQSDVSADISESLDVLVGQTIVENENPNFTGSFGCESHIVLAVENGGAVIEEKVKYTTVEVFIIAKYAEYGIKNGTLIQTGGMISPLALVFESDGSDNYTLLEYWEPGMGSDYTSSLRERFPKNVDYMTNEYDEQLRVECESKAYEHFGISTSGYDKVYTLSVDTVTLSSSFLPRFSIDKDHKTFMFVYDLLSSYLSTGTYEVVDNEITATTYDGKYKYVFKVINRKELQFDAKKSLYAPVTNEDLSYSLHHGDSFILGEPKPDKTSEYTTVVQLIGEEPTTRLPNISPFYEEYYDYTLSIVESDEDIIWQISDEKFRQENGYSVYGYSVDKVYITVGENSLPLDEAVGKGIVSIDALIHKAADDTKDKAKAITYKDGGSTLYVYDDYSVIKLNRLADNSKDVFIGPPDMSLNDLTDFLNNIYG